MFKAVLLATSMLVAAPVFAQDAPKPAESQPAQEAPATTSETAPVTDDAAPDATADQTATAAAAPQTAPATTGQRTPLPQPAEMAAQPAPATPAEPAPVETATAQPAPATAAEPAPAETAAAQPAPAAAQPASTQDQVAEAVGRDFGTYDKDADGALNATEFASWMGTLRKAAEPSFAPESPEAKTWSAQAFTSADADKSASINKDELTTFLTPKPS